MLRLALGIFDVMFGLNQPSQRLVTWLVRQADHKIGVEQVAAVSLRTKAMLCGLPCGMRCHQGTKLARSSALANAISCVLI